ncbi:hypothetical protein AB3S75_041708 [Citrus x aurantiifolia]
MKLQYGCSIRLPYPEIAGDIEAQDKIFSRVTGDERAAAEAWRSVEDDIQYKGEKIYKEEITISVGELLETM